MVGLFTESLGQVTAMARRARAPRKQPLCLEPMHTLDVILRESRGSLYSLPSASIAVARTTLLSSFERIEAAGTALRWVRQATPIRTPEPEVWDTLQRLLGSLDEPHPVAPPKSLLAVAGLLLLGAFGYALDLDRCVVCGRACPDDRAAFVDAVRGGLVCRRCGGNGTMLSGEARQRMRQASEGAPVLADSDVPVVISLVETALAAHANVY